MAPQPVQDSATPRQHRGIEPPGGGRRRRWTGFNHDYISTFTGLQTGRQPTYDEYVYIMTGYTPRTSPGVMHYTGLRFFDHGCDVLSHKFSLTGRLVGTRQVGWNSSDDELQVFYEERCQNLILPAAGVMEDLRSMSWSQ